MYSYHKLSWDYYGPVANRTAEHFHRHLIEWLKRAEEAQDSEVEAEAFWPSKTGVCEHSPTHSSAYCILSAKSAERAARALRVHRVSPQETEVSDAAEGNSED